MDVLNKDVGDQALTSSVLGNPPVVCVQCKTLKIVDKVFVLFLIAKVNIKLVANVLA